MKIVKFLKRIFGKNYAKQLLDAPKTQYQKFQYKVVSRGGTASVFGEAIDWLKNGGIVNQVYKVNPQIPLEMYKDLASFKLYMNDVGLFVNKAEFDFCNSKRY